MSDTASGIDVSFVIAAYNSAGTILPAIKSALAQKSVSLEVLVVDDCSSDDTRTVVGAVAERDPRVRLIALATNLGPGGARNAGIEAAKGRWIAVLDSDDVIEETRSARMMARADAAQADIVVDNLDVVYTDGRPKDTMFDEAFLAKKTSLTLEDFIRSNILFRSTFNFGYMKPMFRRAFLNERDLRFHPTLRIGEDYLLLASALADGGLCVIEPTPGYVYNIREGSISRVLELRHVDAMIAADDDFLSRYTLLPSAMDAQRERSRSLVEAKHFLMLVDGIKQRSLAGVVKVALRDPRAFRHLSMPISARLKRLRSTFLRAPTPQKTERQTS